MRTKKQQTPYQRIIWAAKKGVGIRLTWEQVLDLADDDAITTRAQLDNEDDRAAIDAARAELDRTKGEQG